MRKTIIGLALACAALHAPAQTIGLHLVSHHFPARDFTNLNPGAYWRSDEGWTAGGYRNSLHHLSLYAGRETPIAGPWALQLGAVSGYRGRILPAAAPVLRLDGGLRLTLLPKADPKGAWVVHLSIDLGKPE
jgi:hypothetical protein